MRYSQKSIMPMTMLTRTGSASKTTCPTLPQWADRISYMELEEAKIVQMFLPVVTRPRWPPRPHICQTSFPSLKPLVHFLRIVFRENRTPPTVSCTQVLFGFSFTYPCAKSSRTYHLFLSSSRTSRTVLELQEFGSRTCIVLELLFLNQ